jgi:hypothetical protein
VHLVAFGFSSVIRVPVGEYRVVFSKHQTQALVEESRYITNMAAVPEHAPDIWSWSFADVGPGRQQLGHEAFSSGSEHRLQLSRGAAIGPTPPQRSVTTTGTVLVVISVRCLMLGDLLVDRLHVERFDLTDEVLQGRLWQSPRL